MSFSVSQKCFVRGNARFLGIHKLLKKSFYRTDNGKRDGGRNCIGPRAARMRGIGLDAKLSKYIKSKGRELPKLGSSASGDCLIRLLRALEQWQLAPVATQLCVADGNTRIATAVDLICRDRAGDAVAIELKCGYDGTILTAKGEFPAPLNGVPNSPLNQHFLQLATTLHLLHVQTKTPGLIRTAYVVQVTADNVLRYLLPQTYVVNSRKVYAELRKRTKK